METQPEFNGPCGLYCGVCAILMAHRDRNEKFKERLLTLYRGGIEGKGTLPGAEKLTTADIRCGGCLSRDRFMHCDRCGIRDCTREKGIEGCHECNDFPCTLIDEFPMAVGKKVILRCVPHRRKVGTGQWAKEEQARYLCPECGQKVFRGAARCNACKALLDLD